MNLKLVKIYVCLFLPSPHVLTQVEFHLQRKKNDRLEIYLSFSVAVISLFPALILQFKKFFTH